jgi:hypothetical protein
MREGFRIHPGPDGKTRLIPLNQDAPKPLPPPLDIFALVVTIGVPEDRKRPSWLQLLEEDIGEALVKKHRKSWPSSHELIGDMMILKMEESIREFQFQIIKSKMTANPNVRLVLEDNGVKGEHRVRDLRPIGVRENGKINAVTMDSDISTEVTTRESGCQILCDPGVAYYSSRLQTERIATAEEAKRLSDAIGSPIRVADPFCGVGPALAHMINIPNLVTSVLATDLNPGAIRLLNENLRRWMRLPFDLNNTEFTEWGGGLWSGVADAGQLEKRKVPMDFWNLLIINLPHKFLRFLPLLLPLMDSSKPYVVRGRLVCGDDEIPHIKTKISEDLPDGSDIIIDPRSEYSPSSKLCSVTIRTPDSST